MPKMGVYDYLMDVHNPIKHRLRLRVDIGEQPPFVRYDFGGNWNSHSDCMYLFIFWQMFVVFPLGEILGKNFW